MKTRFLFALAIMLPIGVYSQNKVEKNREDGMIYCPQGTFSTIKKINGKESPVTISVNSFRISQEITNQEYREFYNWVAEHPDDTLFWIDFKQAGRYKEKGMNVSISDYRRSAKYSDILPRLIDLTLWEQESEKGNYRDYFTNPEFDLYPVVGVPLEGAGFYCIWRTNRENSMRKEMGLTPVHDYRIPTEPEWEYAVQTLSTPGEVDINGLAKVTGSKPGKLYHAGDNISEWTFTTAMKEGCEYQVVRGGSWKTGSGTGQYELLDPGSGKIHVGFRVVRSVTE